MREAIFLAALGAKISKGHNVNYLVITNNTWSKTQGTENPVKVISTQDLFKKFQQNSSLMIWEDDLTRKINSSWNEKHPLGANARIITLLNQLHQEKIKLSINYGMLL